MGSPCAVDPCEVEQGVSFNPPDAAQARRGGSTAPEPVTACLSPHICTDGITGVVGIDILKRDIRVRIGLRPGLVAKPIGGMGGLRGDIKTLSMRSRLKLHETVRNSECEWASMAVLTYPKEFPLDGKVVKRHLHAFIQALRRRYGSRVAYLWFLEFQRRGAPHIHFLFDEVAQIDRAWFAATWFRIVGSGDERHLRVHQHEKQWTKIRSPEGAANYVSKYAYKPHQKMVPAEFGNVGRFWGCAYHVKPVVYGRESCDEAKLFELVGEGMFRFMGCADGKYVVRCHRLWDEAANVQIRLSSGATSSNLPRFHPAIVLARSLELRQSTMQEAVIPRPHLPLALGLTASTSKRITKDPARPPTKGKRSDRFSGASLAEQERSRSKALAVLSR